MGIPLFIIFLDTDEHRAIKELKAESSMQVSSKLGDSPAKILV